MEIWHRILHRPRLFVREQFKKQAIVYYIGSGLDENNHQSSYDYVLNATIPFLYAFGLLC